MTNRAGFVRKGSDGQAEYLMQPESFKDELCRHHDVRTVVRVLGAAGWLHKVPGSDSWQNRATLPGVGRQRVYVIVPRSTDDEDSEPVDSTAS